MERLMEEAELAASGVSSHQGRSGDWQPLEESIPKPTASVPTSLRLVASVKAIDFTNRIIAMVSGDNDTNIFEEDIPSKSIYLSIYFSSIFS